MHRCGWKDFSSQRPANHLYSLHSTCDITVPLSRSFKKDSSARWLRAAQWWTHVRKMALKLVNEIHMVPLPCVCVCVFMLIWTADCAEHSCADRADPPFCYQAAAVELPGLRFCTQTHRHINKPSSVQTYNCALSALSKPIKCQQSVLHWLDPLETS